jgi:microsomal dipeptidase-like Zn-dependent dipeptidase
MRKRAGHTLELVGIGSDFLNGTQKAQQLKERIDKWDYMKKLHNERNGYQIEEAAHRMGQNLCKLYI